MTAPGAATHRSAQDWYERAGLCRRAGDLAGALDAYRHSLRLNPRVVAPWVGLAQVLDANSQFEDARQCLQQAVTVDPASALARHLLAQAHQNLGAVEEAQREYEAALELDPRSVAAHFGLGQLQEDRGRPLEAAQAYRTARALDPSCIEALASLLGLGRQIDVAQEMAQAQQLLPQLEPRQRALLGYGLGKACEQQGQRDAAFAAYVVANAARRQLAGGFDRARFDARINELIELFSPAFFAARASWGERSGRPVFVVGLPRSGTTLVEQILASHPDCFGAGELNVLSDLATGSPDRLHSRAAIWPRCVTQLSARQVLELGTDYLRAAGRRAPSAAIRVVDKQPLNFWHLGLVALALPHARIVHCTRDIRDCGFSIFSQNFNLQQQWSTDLGDIAYYWKGYRRLMAHWQDGCGLQILDVAYEDTVSDLPTQARRLLGFVGLPWDERVLSFHASERAVQTPSRWQVRQPLYRSSMARWRDYAQHLAPLLEAVEAEEPVDAPKAEGGLHEAAAPAAPRPGPAREGFETFPKVSS